MKFKEVDVKVYAEAKQAARGGRKKSKSPVRDMIQSFSKAMIPVAEIEDWKGRYKSIENAYACIHQCIKTHDFASCKISKKGNKLFLLNSSVMMKSMLDE